eukprot:437234-Pyramimonas_sp.AAC.1
MERKTYAGRHHRDYHNEKRAKAVQNQQWHYFNSGKLSPEEQAKEEERLKKEAKAKAAEAYRRQVEWLCTPANHGVLLMLDSRIRHKHTPNYSATHLAQPRGGNVQRGGGGGGEGDGGSSVSYR